MSERGAPKSVYRSTPQTNSKSIDACENKVEPQTGKVPSPSYRRRAPIARGGNMASKNATTDKAKHDDEGSTKKKSSHSQNLAKSDPQDTDAEKKSDKPQAGDSEKQVKETPKPKETEAKPKEVALKPRESKRQSLQKDPTRAVAQARERKLSRPSKLFDKIQKAIGIRRERTYVRDEVDVMENSDGKDEDKASGPIDCSDCRRKWASETMGRKIKYFPKEYMKNRRYEPENKATVAFDKNSDKNRYTDVACVDSTRVVLKNRPNDYIHANWVNLPNNSKYICTQAPLEETIEDFWIMVVQEKVRVVAMLCDVIEMGAEKCTQYWPLNKDETMTFGIVKVKNCGLFASGSEEIKYTVLEVEASFRRFFNSTWTVHHYRWTDWPDHLAPASPLPVVDLLRITKAKAGKQPILVHCSAGIGRTGTYVGVDYANEKMKLNQDISMLQVLKEIRAQRLQSVQSTLQYTYMHICLLEYLAQNNVVKREERFLSFMSDYREFLSRYMDRQKKKKKDDDD